MSLSEECATGRSGSKGRVCTGRCEPQGGVSHREEWATRRSGPQGGVSHREEWATGRSGPQGELATGRSGPQGGVSHREEWATGEHVYTCNCWESTKSSSHESLGPFSHYAPYVKIRRTGIT